MAAPKPTIAEREAMQRVREGHQTGMSILELWTDATLGRNREEDADFDPEASSRRKQMNLPQENLLYFLEKHSPVLEPWQCEILRIVRMLAQYLYPQKQTKVMNEGCATFVHYYIINKLFEQGRLTEGAYMEMMHSHTNVVLQPEFDDPRYSGINPYALGFAMMQDIRRICKNPTEEDREWFPTLQVTRTGGVFCAMPGPIIGMRVSFSNSCHRISSASSSCSPWLMMQNSRI